LTALPDGGHVDDARAADERVEPASGVLHVEGQLADLGQAGAGGARVIHSMRGAQLRRGRLELASIAAVEDQGRPLSRELAGQGAAETVGGAGDEDRGCFGYGRFLDWGCTGSGRGPAWPP